MPADDDDVAPAATGDSKVPPGTRCAFCYSKAVMRLTRQRRTIVEVATKSPARMVYACGHHLGRALEYLRTGKATAQDVHGRDDDLLRTLCRVKLCVGRPGAGYGPRPWAVARLDWNGTPACSACLARGATRPGGWPLVKRPQPPTPEQRRRWPRTGP